MTVYEKVLTKFLIYKNEGPQLEKDVLAHFKKVLESEEFEKAIEEQCVSNIAERKQVFGVWFSTNTEREIPYAEFHVGPFMLAYKWSSDVLDSVALWILKTLCSMFKRRLIEIGFANYDFKDVSTYCKHFIVHWP